MLRTFCFSPLNTCRVRCFLGLKATTWCTCDKDTLCFNSALCVHKHGQFWAYVSAMTAPLGCFCFGDLPCTPNIFGLCLFGEHESEGWRGGTSKSNVLCLPLVQMWGQLNRVQCLEVGQHHHYPGHFVSTTHPLPEQKLGQQPSWFQRLCPLRASSSDYPKCFLLWQTLGRQWVSMFDLSFRDGAATWPLCCKEYCLGSHDRRLALLQPKIGTKQQTIQTCQHDRHQDRHELTRARCTHFELISSCQKASWPTKFCGQ